MPIFPSLFLHWPFAYGWIGIPSVNMLDSYADPSILIRGPGRGD